ncbi:hypothetical protein Aazo_1670 ['Nostoc azollae' 0708]|jgi:hypothetical protein|uniref:Uncharacterized protein n=1 Tax=Nostoc azollae (strain 0708) TaxID=551115 RepID=D7E535_NOSA0|nr:hypothetical protein Aazo_1670 ['Nostoc azollae' 0708]
MRLPAFQLVWRNPRCSLPEDPFKLPPVYSVPCTSDLFWQLKYYQRYYVTCPEQVPFCYTNLIIDGLSYNFRTQNNGNWCLENKGLINTQIPSVILRTERRFCGGISWINL